MTTGKHLLDFILQAHGDTPFWIACLLFASLVIAFIALGAWMEARDLKRAESRGEF